MFRKSKLLLDAPGAAGHDGAMHAQKRPRGRPRDMEIDRRILDATRTLLAEGGYRALSFDAVSQRAEVPRSMIYRRWPTKAHLVNEVSTGGGEALPDIIDSDGLEAQVLALVHQILGRYMRADIGAAALGVIAETQGDRALQEELEGASEAAARAFFESIVARGKAAGLVAPDISADVLFDVIVGSLVYRALFSLREPGPEHAAQLTRLVMEGLAPRKG